MKLQSYAFKDGKEIPSLYACDGNKINPPLEFLDVPFKTKSLALLMYDPDIPESAKTSMNILVWDHWVVFNIPHDVRSIEENSVPVGTLGRNTSGTNAYTPPCPPYGTHRYFFKLYALDTMLSLPAGVSKQEVIDAMDGHILDEAELIGIYQRN